MQQVEEGKRDGLMARYGQVSVKSEGGAGDEGSYSNIA